MEMSLFKSYLRRLLSELRQLKKALESQDYDRAKELLETLISDTQSGIED